MRFSLVKNGSMVSESDSLRDICAKFNLVMNQLVFPDVVEIVSGTSVLATVKPSSLVYDNNVFQPEVSHWFKINPTDKEKDAYFKCQEAISIYSDRCMKLLPKPSIVSGDIKVWLEMARRVLENELPIGNPYSTKAVATLSIYHLYTKPPQQREIVKILTQLRLALLYCHISIFSSAGPDTVYYLKPSR
jgi:hypothetical protein